MTMCWLHRWLKSKNGESKLYGAFRISDEKFSRFILVFWGVEIFFLCISLFKFFIAFMSLLGYVLIKNGCTFFWFYNRARQSGDMRKIHVTGQFFEASGPQGHFFEKTKNPVMVLGSVCTKFRVCIFFRSGQKVSYRQTDTRTEPHIYK